MNYAKLILVGCISAFVALATSLMGVTGTIIGSVISSVLYNMLSEALEKPVSEATFSNNFEWEIAYVFPLVVIAIIQLLLIFALLAEWGLLPYTFLNVYLSIQDFANDNLYRVLGFALIVMSAYPVILKPDLIKKSHGAIVAVVGLIFLARGFVDSGNRISNLYNPIFVYFDFPIAVIAFILLLFVIYKIVSSARNSEKEFQIAKTEIKGNSSVNSKKYSDIPKQIAGRAENTVRKSYDSNKHAVKKVYSGRGKKTQHSNNTVKFKKQINEHSNSGINESSNNIQFESNDLLDDYKK